jgi:hypothetical protein
MGYPESNCNGGLGYANIPFFSSPDITLDGVTIGNEELSNNALVWRQMKHAAAVYGKGILITFTTTTYSEYGHAANPIQYTMTTADGFNLRSGDKVVCTREPGDVPGNYTTYAHIEDSSGNDVTDDPYYLGNLYIGTGIYQLMPLEILGPNLKAKTYDGTTVAELDFSPSYPYILPADANDLGFGTSGFTAEFPSPNATAKDVEAVISGTITLTGSKASCYKLIVRPFGRITPAPLTIAAANSVMPYGADPSTIDLSSAYTITGFVNNENESVLTGSLSVTIDPSITASSPAGIYPGAIKIGGYTATNYAITYQSADLEITGGTEPQAITFGPIPNQTLADGTCRLNATASSGLPVSYTSSDRTVATVDADGLVTFLAAGQTTITAIQEGDENYAPATPVSRQLRINVATNNPDAPIILSPNPVPAQKTVSVDLTKYKGDASGIQVEIYDMNGNKVETATAAAGNIVTFDAPAAPGVYVIQVSSTGSPFRGRIALLYVQ